MEEQERYDFGNHSFLAVIGKTILSLNLGSAVRAMLGGLKEGRSSLQRTYEAVSPFHPIKHGTGQKLYDRVPEVALKSLVPISERLTLDLRYVDVYGSTTYRDVVAILALAVDRNPQAVLEFGTYYGSATVNLALNLPNARIHTLDLPEETSEANALVEGMPVDDDHLIKGRQLGKCFRGTSLAERITQHTGDTATYNYDSITDNVSYFLVDGSHTYEYAKGDTLHSFAIGKGLCTFVWHDCDPWHPGVTRWLVEMLDAGLPVSRIRNTAVACMQIDASDPRLRAFQPKTG